MTNKGLDYGFGKTNIDTETSIRFGVINQHHVLQAWADTSEPEYPEPVCQSCNGDLVSDEMDNYTCKDCGAQFDSDSFYDSVDPVAFTYGEEGYTCRASEDGDIFVTKSPFYTYAQLCSPCAPGACYLTSPVEPDLNNKAYCFGHDWFEDGKAPYPVYSVETGKEVTA